jgi:hypothetical protein
MNRSLQPLIFPWMTRFQETAAQAREAGLAMVLSGAPQSGKTHLLELEARCWGRTSDQEVLFVRLQRESDALRQVQVLSEKLAENDLPKDWRLHSLGKMVGFLGRRLRNTNRGLVVLTNCQEAGRDFFNVMFDVIAESRLRGHHCNLMLAGSGGIDDLKELTRDRMGCIRQYAEIPELSHGDVAFCLHAWCEGGSELAKAAETNGEAVEVLDEIQRGTAGNISRLRLFAGIKNHKFADSPITSRLVKDVFSELRVGGSAPPKK